MVGGAGTGERVKKKRLPLLEMLSTLAWKTVVTCGGNTPPGRHFLVRSGWPALHRRSDHNPHDEDTWRASSTDTSDTSDVSDASDAYPRPPPQCVREGEKKCERGARYPHKKRNTRMHMRLGPNTNRGAHTPPQPTSPKPHQRQQRPCPGMFSRSKEVPAIPRPWLA